MVELEVQILALEREGLLLDIGRIVAANGFVLHRHRLVDDRNGVLLSLMVRGHRRSRRALDAALGKLERVVSFTIEPADGEDMRPHFAAARRFDYVPPPPPAPPPVPGKRSLTGPPMPPPPRVSDTEAMAFFDRAPERTTHAAAIEPLPVLDIDADPPWAAWPAEMTRIPSTREGRKEAAPPPAPPAPTPAPVPAPAPMSGEATPLDADPVAVERLMRALPGAYPAMLPLVRAMEQAVVPGARLASLELAGTRVGRWIAARQGTRGLPLSPDEALARRGLPALGELLDAKLQGGQVHLGASPLCGKTDQSGCTFFAGLLQGAMEPMTGDGSAHVIGLCCRALGADECVLMVVD
ncbi:hypothetical protein [Dyella lutea]|uniref:Uncharacterized protein n=1 Tax=Dyella lutea TaxID=2950441 RepID=A0ABT1FEP1_9GAMM|nr:hypothetical protein [Dyella lutea]MCP1375861.1 hypothetical protein [Dyella lutea]